MQSFGTRDMRSDTPTINPFQSYAEQFMDELFADVELLLELDSQARPPAKAEIRYSPPMSFTGNLPGKLQWVDLSIDQPPAQILRQLEQIDQLPEAIALDPEPTSALEVYPADIQIVPTSSSLTLTKLDLSALAVPEPLPQIEVWLPPTPPPTNSWFTQLLWLFLGMSIGLAALSWLYQNKLIQIARPTPALSPGQQEAQIFAQKTRMEIAALNIKAAKSVTPPPTQPPASTAVLPVQPIYVPVYQPPVIPEPQAPQISAPLVPPPPAPVAPPLAKASPDPVKPAQPIVPLGSNSASKFKLVGILAFGEQSAAMVEINGAFQTIKMNSPIGDSGWVLTGLNQQEAILQRNGETRSVSVGQKF
ncbi:MAG: hypothetical protein SFT94_04010 [Pseudanabaenaceae cyanobacterium bins.68]|nr:hypothetical protein [Pseudanabaenaceae cyanobacterium bins.68]